MTVETREEALWLLSKHRDAIKGYGVRACGVFGSVVRGDPDEASDVDILVEFEPAEKNYRNFIALAHFLEEIMGRRVDLVTRESLSPYIGPHILREVSYAPLAD